MKRGGHVAVAVCGVREDFPLKDIPRELQPYWEPGMHFYPLSWWRELWSREGSLRLGPCREMDCLRQAWADWLLSPNPYAQRDIPMMEAEGGRYFSLVQLVGRRAEEDAG